MAEILLRVSRVCHSIASYQSSLCSLLILLALILSVSSEGITCQKETYTDNGFTEFMDSNYEKQILTEQLLTIDFRKRA